MNATEGHSRSFRVTPLALILMAAAVQGGALYGLHLALANDSWLKTHPPLLLALYAVALSVPASVQLLSQHSGARHFWLTIAALGVIFGYFGWHHGSIVGERALVDGTFEGAEVGVPMVVLWLMLLPFLATRLAHGTWSADYHGFFTTAWRNKLLLAEAAMFTIAFWLLLLLWAMLFRSLGVDFFQEMFRTAIFIYPVTALAFGIALHLIGSVERFVGVVLEQILGLFKWLAVVAGLILLLFSIALMFRLPGLLGSGVRIINAAWLLWLVAVMILLLNAAYRDGSGARPYPAFIATALRYIIPAMVLVAAVALYSLGVRISEYGLTTGRFWAVVVAITALVYAAGYSISAFRAGSWMEGMGRVNVSVAIALAATIGIALTPLLSPYRLSANSQYARILAQQGTDAEEASAHQALSRDAWHVLRFDMGRYGRDRLQQLSELQDHPAAERIRARAQDTLAMSEQWARAGGNLRVDVERLNVFPAGRSLDDRLRALLAGGAPGEGQTAFAPAGIAGCSVSDEPCFGLYIDLDRDGIEEFVLFGRYGPSYVFSDAKGLWSRTGSFGFFAGEPERRELQDSLTRSDFGAQDNRLQDLRIGNRVFEFSPVTPDDAIPAPAIAP
jgi:hypothetical protein